MTASRAVGVAVLRGDRLTITQELEWVAPVGVAPEVVVHRAGLGDRIERGVRDRVADAPADDVILPPVDLGPLHATAARLGIDMAGERVERLVVVVVGVEREVVEGLEHAIRVL